MSAERLREAAALMRERAEGARAGRWYTDGSEVLAAWSQPQPIAVCDGSLPEGNHINATHIASWHPAVALAVADWLDFQAEVERRLGGPDYETPANHPALAVADAYLGSAS